jgi:hypothetical protein
MRDRQRRLDHDEYQAWLDENAGESAGWWPVIGYAIICVALGALLVWAIK